MGGSSFPHSHSLMVFEELRRLEKDLYDSLGSAFDQISASRLPVDIGVQDNRQVIMRVDLPGVSEDKLEVVAHEDSLTVTGHKPCLSEELAQSSKGKPDSFVLWHAGRSCGQFEKTFLLPRDIKPSSVDAEIHNGVLSVTADLATSTDGRSVSVRRTK